jgi:hypothetical protein
MFTLSLKLTQTSCFEGPGLFRFDFKECVFENKFYTYDNSEKSLERVINSLKTSGLLSQGRYKWYDNNFGPVIIKNIEPKDFKQIENLRLATVLNNLIEGTTKKYYNLSYTNSEIDIVKRKIQNAIEFIPLDKVLFFIYNIEINKTNSGNIKLEEHNLFDYFYFVIGYNEVNFYLLTLFYE